MKAPDKIYLQVCGDCPLDRVGCEKCRFVELGEVTWSEEKIFDKDVEYIRNDLLLDYLKKEFSVVDFHLKAKDDAVWWGQRNAFQQVIDKLNSL